MANFRVLRSTRAAEVGFLAVDDLEIESPYGETLHRVVVRHPGAVVIVPIELGSVSLPPQTPTAGGASLPSLPELGPTAVLVRQYRAALDEHVLEVPAGKRDVEGEPPPTTAARELEEELGLRAGRLVKLAEFYNSPGFCDERAHLFLALDLQPAERSAPTSAEERDMTVERVPLASVEALIADGTLHDAKSIIGLLLARQYLAGALPGIDVQP